MAAPEDEPHTPRQPSPDGGNQDSPFLKMLGETLFPGPHLLPSATMARIADTYDYTLRARGPTPRSVLWRSRWSQWWRFHLLLGILTRDDKRRGQVSINDFGCGYGALFHRLRKKPYMRGGAYYGYDLCPAMVRTARMLVPDHRPPAPEPLFIDSDRITHKADFTLCSGTFGLRLETPEDEWRAYVQETLRHLASYSRRGMAFNLLNAAEKKRRKTLYYADPEDYMDFCQRTFGPKVRLVDGGMRGVDFTIHVRF